MVAGFQLLNVQCVPEKKHALPFQKLALNSNTDVVLRIIES